MPLATLVTANAVNLTFAQHLVLWLHVGFAVFTLGPLTLAISSTPRYIRRGEVTVLRYLARITLVFLIASLGVLVAGVVLSQMLNEASKPYLIVAETLFLVTIVLLVLIVRDQRAAIRTLADEATQAASLPSGTVLAQRDQSDAVTPPGEAGAEPGDDRPGPSKRQVATVERGRIAMLGGLVSLIYLVILALMIFNN